MVHHVIDGIFIRNIKLTGLDTGGPYLFQSVHAPSAGNQGHSLSHIPPLFLFPALTYTACVRWGTVVQIPGPYTNVELELARRLSIFGPISKVSYPYHDISDIQGPPFPKVRPRTEACKLKAREVHEGA